MSAPSTTRLASAAAGLAIAWGLAAAAYADAPPTLPALSAQPSAVTPGGTVLVRGTNCVGTGGQPGVATVTVTGSDGSSTTSSVSGVDANGSWGLSVKAPAAEGSLSVNATCDIYGQAIAYPSASLTVSATGQSAPPVPPSDPSEPPGEPAPTQAPSPAPQSPGTNPGATGGSSSTSRTTEATASPDDDLPNSGLDVAGFAMTATALLGAGAAVAYVGRRHR